MNIYKYINIYSLKGCHKATCFDISVLVDFTSCAFSMCQAEEEQNKMSALAVICFSMVLTCRMRLWRIDMFFLLTCLIRGK